MLEQLRERLLEPSDAFPGAAQIPQVDLVLKGNRITMTAEIHAAVEVAVPLPGRLPDWSPLSISIDGDAAELACRRDGYLWVVVPQGVHQVVVDSLLSRSSEWEWTFLLPPRTVSIDAPEWTVTGVQKNGIPEAQVFFARQRQAVSGVAAYDRSDFNAVVVVNRHLETGLEWQVSNEVVRLSRPGKAVSIRVPLLPGERVLTSNVVIQDQQIEVRLGADQQSFSWKSQLPIGQDVHLLAKPTKQWVERWYLVTSAVWNVSQAGLSPVFEQQEQHLVPEWHPWPGEQVTLSFHKPQAVAGETVTVRSVQRTTSLGLRQRTTNLKIDLECTLARDFHINLQPTADISSVQVNQQAIPVRRDKETLIVPVEPGQQSVSVKWRSDLPLETVVESERIGLPTAAANIYSVVRIGDSRWVLWTRGPTRGPAVRFWVILLSAILAALVLGKLRFSPLSRFEWALLAIGLTQVHVTAAMIVVSWLMLLAFRGKSDLSATRWWSFNVMQVGLVLLTLISLGILIFVVVAGLLGNPDMFIIGNGSSKNILQWYQPQAEQLLPVTTVISISVWYYRLLMLLWALWLASALLRWLTNGWQQFSQGGAWRRKPTIETGPH